MEVGIERLAALAFIITGLSHIAAPSAWARFFILVRDQGEAGGFINAFIHMPLGLLILAFHQVWQWPGLLVTIIGCALTLKGLLYLLFPKLALTSMARVTEERGGPFRIAGLGGLLLGLLIGWIALANGRQLDVGPFWII
jgi:uncharacterized protein YjeT (DUF2065 family)